MDTVPPTRPVFHLAGCASFRPPGRPVVLPLVLVAWLVFGCLSASANRFGPPWQSRVSVDGTTLYSQADRGSAPLGPLSRGQIVVVVAESQAADGTAWTQTPDGWLVSDQITEDVRPWV